jgi:hypothetical protein
MTIPLNGTDSIQGNASAAGAIECAVWGRFNGATYENLVPSGGAVTLGTSVGTIYSPTSTNYAVVSYATLTNVSTSTTSASVFANGSTTRIAQFTIVPGGRAEYAQQGWHLYDGNGNLQTVGQQGIQGLPASSFPFNISQTFALQGTIVASATTPVPWFYAPPLAAGQTLTIQEANCSMLTGTCTVAVNKATFASTPSFSAVTGLSAIAVTTTPTTTAATGTPTVNARDIFQIVITSPASTPAGLTVTIVFQVTA